MIKELSGGKPFGVNFTIVPSKRYQRMMDEWMEISIDEGVKFFLTSLGKPDPIVKKAHKHGIKVYHDVHNATLARRAVDAGVDGLNLLNSDMGGQTGSLDAYAFLEEVAKDIQVPIICAGGIGSELDFTKALERGYSGVQMGTRFLATHECQITDAYKQAIVASTAEDIVLTNKLAGTWSSVIRTPTVLEGGLEVNWLVAWLLRNPQTKNLARMFLLSLAVKSYKKATFEDSHAVWQAGKGVTGIHKVESVAEVLERFSKAYHQP